MTELGLDTRGAEHLLWDRLLHRELAASGKRIIADKTPNNVFIVDRLREAWPDARFIYLLRHPAAIARSRQSVRGEHADSDEKNVALIRRYCVALEKARQTYPGHTVRYEDLTAEPERETRAICAFLGLEWEPGMLEYGKLRPRPLQGRPRRLGRQDQDRPDPAARAAARGHPARPARDDREVGLSPRRGPARSQRVAAWRSRVEIVERRRLRVGDREIDLATLVPEGGGAATREIEASGGAAVDESVVLGTPAGVYRFNVTRPQGGALTVEAEPYAPHAEVTRLRLDGTTLHVEGTVPLEQAG